MLDQVGSVMDLVKKMQQNMEEAQRQLKDQRIEVESGDVVKVIVNGQQDVVSIELNNKYLNAENAALLQDLLVATINNAIFKSRDLNQSTMAKLATDLNLPKIPGLF